MWKKNTFRHVVLEILTTAPAGYMQTNSSTVGVALVCTKCWQNLRQTYNQCLKLIFLLSSTTQEQSSI